MIVIGIQTESSIGNLSVFPNAAEKSLKKKINMLDIIVKNAYEKLLSLYLFPKVNTELSKTMLSKKNGKASDLCNFTCISFVE